MLRFPNPGSTIDNFVKVYVAAFERLNGYIIDLDDFVQAVVAANLATSSGHVGEEAVARSTREDRSRDPLYNQLKMYAELLRALGWLHPTAESSLNYTFTLLGHQAVAAGDNYMPLFRECVLGIVYPSRVLEVKGDFDIRPFAFLLKVMAAAGGYISRDEMIVGPLNRSDRAANSVQEAAKIIAKARAGKTALDNLLDQVARARGIQINTLHNYTRWPIAVLRDCGWATKVRAGFQLTALGQGVVQWLQTAQDVRLDQVESLDAAERTALSLEAHYGILGRCEFDLTPVLPKLEAHQTIVLSARQKLALSAKGELLYSPFQTVAVTEIGKIFPPTTKPVRFSRKEREDIRTAVVGRGSRDHLFVSPIMVPAKDERSGKGAEAVKAELRALLTKHGSVNTAAEAFAELHARDTKHEFYPLVSHLFEVLKYRSEYSRAGVNYQRWDAAVWIDETAIPIEIKSPTEEEFLSIKAVRQALENKIVLLSRGGLKTSPKLTSLIVGYRIPNERGDMSTLIDDIHKTYGFSIGVIDLKNLAALAAHAINEKKTISSKQLSSLRGFLDV